MAVASARLFLRPLALPVPRECSRCQTTLACPCTPAHLAGNTDAARLAYAAGIKRCLDAVPLWVAAARLEEGTGNVAKARALLEQASGVLLPVLLAAAVDQGTLSWVTSARATAVLPQLFCQPDDPLTSPSLLPQSKQARLKNPKNPQLWLAAVRTEMRAQNTKAAEALMAKALQVGWSAACVCIVDAVQHA